MVSLKIIFSGATKFLNDKLNNINTISNNVANMVKLLPKIDAKDRFILLLLHFS